MLMLVWTKVLAPRLIHVLTRCSPSLRLRLRLHLRLSLGMGMGMLDVSHGLRDVQRCRYAWRHLLWRAKGRCLLWHVELEMLLVCGLGLHLGLSPVHWVLLREGVGGEMNVVVIVIIPFGVYLVAVVAIDGWRRSKGPVPDGRKRLLRDAGHGAASGARLGGG